MKFFEKISFFKKKRKQIFEAQVPWPLGIRDRTALFKPRREARRTKVSLKHIFKQFDDLR